MRFANKDDMEAIDKNLHRMCQNASDQEYFGGKHIVFAGDFRQLDPIGKEPLCSTDYGLEHRVNCYLELRGNHRFKDDPEWGDLPKKFRDGTIRTEDIEALNKHIEQHKADLPENIKYAVYENKNRDMLNEAVFWKAIKHK